MNNDKIRTKNPVHINSLKLLSNKNLKRWFYLKSQQNI